MKAFAISAVLVTTLFGITRLEAQKNTPRSVQSGNQSVVVSLSNTTTRNLSVLWVDFDGKAQNYGALAPGQTMQTQTYPGHLWQLSDGNNIFGTYRATTAATQQFATLQGATPPAGVVQNTPQRMPQQRTSTTGQVVGGLLQKLIDKKTGRQKMERGRVVTDSSDLIPAFFVFVIYFQVFYEENKYQGRA